MTGKVAKFGVKLTAKHDSLYDCIGRPDILNHRLLQYVLAGVRTSEGYTTLSLCSDKASVCGLTLDAGAFVWPGNECSVAAPQVLG